MWERQPAIEAIGALLDGVRGGRGGALFLVGDAGVGKSALLEDAERRAGAGVEVVRAAAAPVESGVPFALISQVLDGLGVAERLGEGTAADHLYRVREWLRRYDRPLLVATDDLHWADRDSLVVLSFLARRLAELPVGLVATLRPWPPEAADIVAGLAHDDHARSVTLPPLTEAGAEALLADRVGRALPTSVVHTAQVLTAGNPLLLVHLSSVLAEGADLPRLDTPPDTVRRRLLLRRFTDLSEAGMGLARAAAVLGVRFRPSAAVELAGLSAADGDAVLDGLLAHQVLRETPGCQVEFTHPLIRQLLYDDLPAVSRLRLHGNTFRMLDACDRPDEAAEHAVLGDLVGDERAVAVLTRTGRAAFEAGALSTAVRYLNAACVFAGDAADAVLLLLTGRALLAAGRADDAVEVLAAAEEPSDDLVRAQLARELGRASYQLGRPHDAARYFARAVELVQVVAPGVAVEALLDQATAGHVHDVAASLEPARQALELIDRVDPVTRRRAQSAWGYLSCINGDGAGLAAVAEAAEQVAADPAAQLADLSWGWGALSSYAYAAKWFDRFEDSERCFELALTAADRLGAASSTGFLLASRTELYIRTGRLDAAGADVARALELGDLAPLVRRYTTTSQVWLLLLLDEWDEELCERLEAEARPLRDLGSLLTVWWLQGRRALHEGDLARACARFELVEETTSDAGLCEPCVVPWARDAILGYARAGRRGDVLRVVGLLDAACERVPCVWPRSAADLGRAVTASSAEAAEPWLDRAVASLQQSGQPLELVEALLADGEWSSRAGRPRRARAQFAEALNIAERFGSPWLARRARHQLSKAGGRRRSRPPSELTPAERRVADLAAAGHSNAEIASILTVAVTTVETHLRRIYTKVGVRNRRELMLRDHFRADT
ncbi:AAA family ATPase [Amycolatopsis coloradensis]|uniref:AAA family ATPase n=1 Tax=Amycolatopsis coloradensis TaxID=76021 RepID=A0ACD5BK83_9PSEU